MGGEDEEGEEQDELVEYNTPTMQEEEEDEGNEGETVPMVLAEPPQEAARAAYSFAGASPHSSFAEFPYQATTPTSPDNYGSQRQEEGEGGGMEQKEEKGQHEEGQLMDGESSVASDGEEHEEEAAQQQKNVDMLTCAAGGHGAVIEQEEGEDEGGAEGTMVVEKKLGEKVKEVVDGQAKAKDEWDALEPQAVDLIKEEAEARTRYDKERGDECVNVCVDKWMHDVGGSSLFRFC